jgi:hypothetical protein
MADVCGMRADVCGIMVDDGSDVEFDLSSVLEGPLVRVEIASLDAN